MKKPTCETCVYFHYEEIKYTNDYISGCRRHPLFEPKEKTTWCGEHQDFEKWLRQKDFIDEHKPEYRFEQFCSNCNLTWLSKTESNICERCGKAAEFVGEVER
jgi:hypothetical protein